MTHEILQPMILPMVLYEGHYAPADIEELKAAHPVWKTRDIFAGQLHELFEITQPQQRLAPDYAAQSEAFVASRLADPARGGNWVYFPWSGELLHTVNEQEQRLLRTNRNRNLITQEEQEALAGFTVGIAGLSIGNGMVVGLVHGGIGGSFKIADFDRLATTNLNRIRAGLPQVGLPKIQITAQQIYEVDPYAKLVLYEEGVKNETLAGFVGGSPPTDLLFDAIDDFEIKVRLRLQAKQARVPVVMLTNLGDSLLVDVERYDLEADLPIFNGLIGATADEILSKPLTEADKQSYAVSIVGRDNVPPRAMASVQEINKTLAGRPQLMSTVSVGAGMACFLARQILLKEQVPSGRKRLTFDQFYP